LKKNPFQDIRVRRALAGVIDREALLREALDGDGDTLAQLVVPEAFGFSPGIPRAVPDPAAAKKLMAEAGFGAGFGVALDFEGVGVEDSMERVVRVLARQFAQIGVRVKPQPHTTQDLLSRVESHDTSFYLLSWVGTSGDLGSTAEFLLRTPSEGRGTDNGGNYSSPEADALIDEASATLDPAARLAILRRLEERVRADLPVIPLLRREDLYGVAKGISFELRLDREIRGVTMEPRLP
jgi:peptide/nickel transport system substrate-binding protein